jgi:hypothetical protein
MRRRINTANLARLRVRRLLCADGATRPKQAQAGLRAGGRANKWVSRSTPTISEYAAAVLSSAARPALSITVGTVSQSRSAAVRRPKSHIAGLAISATIAVAIGTGEAASKPLMARIIPLPNSCAKSDPGKRSELGRGGLGRWASRF